MFNIFKSDKEKIRDIHLAYRNGEIDVAEYRLKLQKALYDIILSKEAKKILSDLGIDVLQAKDVKLEDIKCSVKKLQVLANETMYLVKVMEQIEKVVEERGAKADPDVMKFGRRYAGIPIISYDEIMEIVKSTERENKCDCITDKQTLHIFFTVNFSTSNLHHHATMLTLHGMVNSGATIE